MTNFIGSIATVDAIVDVLETFHKVDRRFSREVLRLRRTLLAQNARLHGDMAETAALINAMMGRDEEDVGPVYAVTGMIETLLRRSRPSTPRATATRRTGINRAAKPSQALRMAA